MTITFFVIKTFCKNNKALNYIDNDKFYKIETPKFECLKKRDIFFSKQSQKYSRNNDESFFNILHNGNFTYFLGFKWASSKGLSKYVNKL